jgi:hypothetical protein
MHPTWPACTGSASTRPGERVAADRRWLLLLGLGAGLVLAGPAALLAFPRPVTLALLVLGASLIALALTLRGTPQDESAPPPPVTAGPRLLVLLGALLPLASFALTLALDRLDRWPRFLPPEHGDLTVPILLGGLLLAVAAVVAREGRPAGPAPSWSFGLAAAWGLVAAVLAHQEPPAVLVNRPTAWLAMSLLMAWAAVAASLAALRVRDAAGWVGAPAATLLVWVATWLLGWAAKGAWTA